MASHIHLLPKSIGDFDVLKGGEIPGKQGYGDPEKSGPALISTLIWATLATWERAFVVFERASDERNLQTNFGNIGIGIVWAWIGDPNQYCFCSNGLTDTSLFPHTRGGVQLPIELVKKKHHYNKHHHGHRYRHRRHGYGHYYRGYWYAVPWWLGAAAVTAPYYGGPRYGGDAHVEWCLNRYRSYNPRTDTFRGYDGYDHRCISPYM